MRGARSLSTTIGVLAAAGLGAFACAVDLASDESGLREAPGSFASRFLAVSDADMSATAYADGKLEPIPGARDEIALLDGGRVVGTVPASNSVVSWPQILDVSDDGRFAAVVETRGAPPPGVDSYENVGSGLPIGSRLEVFAIEPDGLRRVDGRDGLGQNLQSVEFVGNDLLVIGSESAGAELAIVRLDEAGGIEAVRTIALAVPVRDDDREKHIRTVHVAPDGETLAVNVATRRIQFYRLARDAAGIPHAATALGSPSADLGRRVAVGRWTRDGRFFLVSDTNGGGSRLNLLFQGPGAVIALRPPREAKDAPQIVSRAEVGRFPESFAISPDGTRVAAINMERTYLPELRLLDAWPGRRRYSVSLLGLEPETGRLEMLDRIEQAGILPEDILFDATGRNLAVAVFHRRKGPDRRRGFIDFYSIENGRRLVSQGVTQPLMRGAHGLAGIP